MLESLQGSTMVRLLDACKKKAAGWGLWKPSQQIECAGLDIGSGFARVVNINSTKKPFLVTNCYQHPLPPGTIVKNEIKEPVQLVTALKIVLSQSGLKTNNVAIAMPRALASVKTITMDSRLTADEIQSRAWIEASRHFPDLIGNIYLDFFVTGAVAQDPSRVEVMLAACRKDQVNPWLDAIQRAGFSVEQVDLNCYALERAVRQGEMASSRDMLALLNLNHFMSSLIVLKDGALVYAHDQDFDSQRLMSQLVPFLKDKASWAEEALFTDEGYQNILKENLVSHLRHILHFFSSTQPEGNVSRLILSGDCASIPALGMFVEKEMGIPAQKADPFRHMTFESDIDEQQIREHAPEFMLGSGLALSKRGGHDSV